MPGFDHVKVTMKLASNRGDTCSESFFYAASAVGPLDFSGNPVLVDANNLVQKRKLCLVRTWYVQSVRVAPAPLPDQTATRGSLLWRVQGRKGQAPAKDQDVPNTVRLITLRTATGHVRQYDLHGIPDLNTTYDDDGDQDLSLSAGMKAYADYLKTSGKWQLKILKVAANDPGNPTIQTIAVAAGVITMQTDAGLGITNKSRVIVSGCQGWKAGQFNGTFKVASYDNVTGILTITTKRDIDPNIFYVRNSGRLRLVAGAVVGFDTITTYDDLTSLASSHKTGNPIDGRRGRRSAKR